MYYKNAKQKFDLHVNEQIDKAKPIYLRRVNQDRILQLINQKYLHSLEVTNDATNIARTLNFDSSFVDLIRICGLNHDIGRFEQALLNGNYSDKKLIDKIGVNHGGLGVIILAKGELKKQLPTTRIFDKPILRVVRNHVDAQIPDKDLLVLANDLLRSKNAEEFFTYASDEEKKQVANVITQIIQDVDRLDIYHQILDGRHKPLKSKEDIPEEIKRMFDKGLYLDVNAIKEDNKWNANVGDLVRLSFINQIRLLSVAKMILDENLIMRMKEIRNNPKVGDAFDYQQEKLERMVKESEDGILVKKLTK